MRFHSNCAACDRKLAHYLPIHAGGLINRPLAKVVAEVLWGLNKGDRSPVFLRSSGLIHKKT